MRRRKDGTFETLLDPERVNRAQLRCDVRQWRLTKMLPKTFGDRLNLTPGTKSVPTSLNDEAGRRQHAWASKCAAAPEKDGIRMTAALFKLTSHFRDQLWRLNNLYFVTDKDGRRVKFVMNSAQAALFEGMHNQNVILKARQRGFTTFIQLFMLDACVFNSDIRAGTIAHTLADAQIIFRDKVRFPYDNLPEAIKKAVGAQNDNSTELLLANNSSIRIGVSLRSGTLQYLHVSEYGKICAKFPDKAREVRSGALNTVDKNQMVFVESTAEGKRRLPIDTGIPVMTTWDLGLNDACTIWFVQVVGAGNPLGGSLRELGLWIGALCAGDQEATRAARLRVRRSLFFPRRQQW